MPAEPLEVPIFPLPKLVLFPGTLLPLHIFEPRYREMTRDALRDAQRLIAVAQLKPGWEAARDERPAIYPVAGVGRITQHLRNPDGTYEIVLEAVARVQLREIDPGEHMYRRASATLLQEHAPQNGVSSSDVSALLSIATRIAAIVRRALPSFAMQAEHDDTPGVLSDRIADQFVLDPAARQDLLETLDISARIRALTMHLAQLHMALSSNDGGNNAPTLH
jgi:Lon protease-like protein